MATLSVTNTFSAGTTIVAADVNQNYTDIETFVNSSPGVVQKDIVDAKGDIIAATGSDAVSRLAAGTNTHVLTADSSEPTGLKWAPSPAVDVVTTKGDLIAATAADTVTRLGVGSNTQVLTADSSTGTGLSWTTPTAGTVTTVTGTLPIVSSGGATPAISVVTSNDQLILNNQVFS